MIRSKRKKLYKFLGFYTKKKDMLIGRMGTVPLQVHIKKTSQGTEWAGIYFIGSKEDFKFLTLTKEPNKKHFKCSVVDVEFYLVKVNNPSKNKFDYILYIGYVGARVHKINEKVVSYKMEEFIFADTLE